MVGCGRERYSRQRGSAARRRLHYRGGRLPRESSTHSSILSRTKWPIGRSSQPAAPRSTRRAAKALADRGAGGSCAESPSTSRKPGTPLAAARRFAEAAGEHVHRDPDPASRCWRKVRALCAPLPEPEARAPTRAGHLPDPAHGVDLRDRQRRSRRGFIAKEWGSHEAAGMCARR